MIEQFEYLNLAVNLAQIIVVQTRLVDNLNRDLNTTITPNYYNNTDNSNAP